MAFALTDDVRNNEVFRVLDPIMGGVSTREQGWNWLQDNLEGVLAGIPLWRKGRVTAYAEDFCEPERLVEIENFFGDKVEALQGGPRSLANTLERIQLCVAMKEHYSPQLQQWANR